MVSLLAEFCFATLVVLAIIYWIRYLQLYKIRKYFETIPGPPRVPIFGNALDFSTSAAFLPTLARYTRDYGPLVNVKIELFKWSLVVSDYKLLEFLLSTNKVLTKSVNYTYLEPWLGTGLLTSTGQKWKSHRKILTPAFHFKILEEFVEIFESAGAILVKKLQQQDGNKSLDIYPYITLCTLDIICESAMGTQVNAQGDENSAYVQSVKEMCRILIVRAMSPISGNDYLYPFTRDYYLQKKALKVLHDYTNSVIDAKLEVLRNKSSENEENINDIGCRKRKAFLDLLLEATVDGQSLSREEIREEVDTFMFEGHDTTASAITFTLYMLANHPEIQEKVLEEQRSIFGSEQNPAVIYSDLQQMKYLELVIKETLRLYPSVPVIGRKSDQEIEFDGKIIPKGVGFLMYLDGIHKNPEYFPNPLHFDPERFRNFDGKLPYCYLPFSAGSRNCIGQRFAMAEVKSTVSKVVRNFELTPAFPRHSLELIADAVLKSENGCKIGLKSRIGELDFRP